MRPIALKSAELRKLFQAQVPADFADWLDVVAISTLFAFVWEVPGYAYAFFAVGMGAPYLIVGPVAGALVDRLSVRQVLIWSNVGRGVGTAALILAENWVVLVVLVALRSTLDCFFSPARQAAIQALTTSRDRTSANGLSHGINQASKIVAPGAGGTFLIWFAPATIFLVNAAISILAALLCARLAEIARHSGDPESGEDGLWASVRGGLAYVRAQPIVRSVLLMMAAMFFAMFIYDFFIAPLAEGLGYQKQHLGYALAAVGAGGVVGSVVFSVLPDLRKPQFWIAAGTGISGVMALLLGLSELRDAALPVMAFIGVFFVLGLTTAMSVVPFQVVLQNTVPEHRMGSVTALSEAANTIALLTAPFVGAVLVGGYSVGAPFLVGSVVMLVAAALVARLKFD